MNTLVTLLIIQLVSIHCQIIENEFLIRLNTDIIRNESEENAFLSRLAGIYSMDPIKIYHASRLTIAFVKGNLENAMRLRNLPEVVYVENNGYVHALQSCTEEPSPGTWGLDRIDQRNILSYSDPQNPGATYIRGDAQGTGAYVYVADTGIETTHVDFGGRAIWGYTVSGINEPETDLNGHGTHCAGISTSASYGVAKSATVVAVKCLSRFGSGSFSDVIEGLNWILQNHTDREVASGSRARSVVDLSLGGGGSNSALEDFIQQMFEADITVVVSSGSSMADACSFTPARTPNATTVATVDITDSSTNSNYGTCLDIFAPGAQILSTWLNNSTAVLSGTSMAASHVVGVVARYQSSQDPAPTSQQVSDWLRTQATPDVLNLGPEHATSPNLLVYADCLY